MICIDEGMPSFEVALLLVGIQWILSMGVHGEYPWVSGCLPVGQYWILRYQHGAFHWEGQFHPPWGLIAGIRGGMRGGGAKKKIEGQGWKI